MPFYGKNRKFRGKIPQAKSSLYSQLTGIKETLVKKKEAKDWTNNPPASKALSPTKELAQYRSGKREQRKFKFQTASPLSSSFSNAFGSVNASLQRRGYSQKDIRAIQARSRERNRKREQARRNANKGFSGVIGWGM